MNFFGILRAHAGNVSGGYKCRSPNWAKLSALPNPLSAFERPLSVGEERGEGQERRGRKEGKGHKDERNISKIDFWLRLCLTIIF